MFMLDVDVKIQTAITFLVENFNETGHNTKPVILHSIRIAMRLYDYGYSSEIIIGALLHDLIEDSDVTKEAIAKEFGDQIADLVNALSFDSDIEDYQTRYEENFERIMQYGKEAIIIKAADLLDNSEYYQMAGELYPTLVEKFRYFCEISEEMLREEKIWSDLEDKLGMLNNQAPA